MSLSKIKNIPYGKNIIELKNISLSFGGVKALTEVSFEVKRGEVFAIIGPNGAGKSSMLNVINGFYKPTEGTITFKGQSHQQMKTHEAATQGIARTFQNIALFNRICPKQRVFQPNTSRQLCFCNRWLGVDFALSVELQKQFLVFQNSLKRQIAKTLVDSRN